MPIRPRTPSCRGRAGRRSAPRRGARAICGRPVKRDERGVIVGGEGRARLLRLGVEGSEDVILGGERAGMTGGGAREERGGAAGGARAWWASKLARLGSGRKGGFTVRASRASQSIAANQACARTFVPSPSAPSRAATSGSSSVRTSDGAQSPSAGAKTAARAAVAPHRLFARRRWDEYQSKDRPRPPLQRFQPLEPRSTVICRRRLGWAAAPPAAAGAGRRCTRASPSAALILRRRLQTPRSMCRRAERATAGRRPVPGPAWPGWLRAPAAHVLRLAIAVENIFELRTASRNSSWPFDGLRRDTSAEQRSITGSRRRRGKRSGGS